MSKNNDRTEQQEVDVFDTNSAEDTKDNIIIEEKEDKRKRQEELEQTMSSIKWANDPLDW
jgi:hypothetical protein